MIAMLGHSELDTEVSDADMETAESDDCRGVSKKDGDANGVLAMMREGVRFSCKDRQNRLFLRCFLRLSLVNLPLLASLEERSTYRVLGCFLEAGDRDDLEGRFLVDEATRGVFALLWEAVTELEVEAFPCF